MIEVVDLKTQLPDLLGSCRSRHEATLKTSFMYMEEAIAPFDASPHLVELKPPIHRRRTQAGNDMFVKFIQIAFGDHGWLLDIPNTVLSERESQSLMSVGFRRDLTSSFQPAQKKLPASATAEFAQDIIHVWSTLWGLSAARIDLY